MVSLHCGVLALAAIEVVVLRRPWVPGLGWPMLAVFVMANAARWWVIRTLGPRWNVQVMPASLGVITNRGPYRWVRHPNYAAVFVEMLALPMIHAAWLTAAAGAIAHVFVLRRRVELEESVMRRDPAWSAAFEHRARFVPGLL
jgi:methyltransferase